MKTQPLFGQYSPQWQQPAQVLVQPVYEPPLWPPCRCTVIWGMGGLIVGMILALFLRRWHG